MKCEIKNKARFNTFLFCALHNIDRRYPFRDHESMMKGRLRTLLLTELCHDAIDFQFHVKLYNLLHGCLEMKKIGINYYHKFRT